MAKNKWLAALLSFFIAGLGQLYLGRYQRAIAFFLLDILTAYVAMSQNNLASNIGLALNLLVTAVAVADAYVLAGKAEGKTEGAKKTKKEDEKEQTAKPINLKAY